MEGELVIVGDEVLDGRVLNTNAHYLAGRLAALGLGLTRITTVGDRMDELAGLLGLAASRSAFVLVTGGLGPTEDDRTTATAASAFARPLSLQAELLQHIEAVCRDRGQAVGELEKLAWLPHGAKPLHPQSNCCGFFINHGRCLVVFLPGVPSEVEELFDAHVVPLLMQAQPGRPGFLQRRLKLFGLGESQAAARIKDIWLGHGEVTFGSYPVFPEVHLSLTARGEDAAELTARLDRVEAEIRNRLGEFVFGRDDETMEGLLGQALRARGLKLAVAESCTGGRIAQRLTSVPGASDYFVEGLVTYANEAKERLLGVPRRILEAHGAVSAETAEAMARGLLERSGVDLALSVTGIAGPSGGSPAKPVGTVFFGLAGLGGGRVEQRLFQGERARIQGQAAACGLNLLRGYVVERTGG